MRLSDTVTSTETSDGIVLLHQRSGVFWQLNGSGAMVVQMLLAGQSADEAADRLVERYDVRASEAAADVAILVDQLRENQLVAE
jgi:hypothetical protein